jgi:hypothetical protein
MPPAHKNVNNNDRDITAETPQPPEDQRPLDESLNFSFSQQQNHRQQFNNNHFTVIVGNDVQSMFPRGQIILAPSPLYSAPSTIQHVVCSNSSENSEKKQRTDMQKMEEEIGLLNRKTKMQTPEKLTVGGVTMATVNKNDKQENHGGKHMVQDSITENTTDCGPEVNSLNTEGLQEELSHKKKNILTSEKKLSQDPVFLQESDFQVSENDELQISTCNLTDFLKSSNKTCKSVENLDLVVETTDFFTMVMSPSVKSLPSPSERLKHLTLSSPVDTLLSYEDDGMYQFLLTSDDMAVHTNPGRRTDGGSIESSKSNGRTTQRKETDTSPLQTINEESLKQLLYGSSSS